MSQPIINITINSQESPLKKALLEDQDKPQEKKPPAISKKILLAMLARRLKNIDRNTRPRSVSASPIGGSL